MFIYNLTLVGLGWIIQSTQGSKFKTLYSFSMFSFEGFFLFSMTIFLFSLAGVPPFMGFFNKLYLMSFMVNSCFFIFYPLLLILLLIGLYFYVQNIRFLHSTNYSRLNLPFLFNVRITISLNYYLILLIFFITVWFQIYR